jgi:muramoyltetrapeptide carboxypeptidase LdcA involved in peptidoglycan recycling
VIVPPRVHPGDAVAVVSPSAPAAARYPHRLERGIAYLASLGLEVKVMPNARRAEGWVSAPPEDRAADLHAAFADDDVSVVLAAIGGNHSNQVLQHLDYELIRSHPKIFQGYSDMTVLHWAFAKHAGLSTFYGPAFVPELGEFPEVFPYTDRYLRAAWFGDAPITYEPANAWTDELRDWNQRLDETGPRELRKSDGWVTVREGSASGPLIGGAVETICWHLKGSSAWLALDGAILLFETSEEAPPPPHLDAYLADLEQLGVFGAAAGLLIARPYGYTPEDAEVLWDVVAHWTEASGIPVLANVDCGHTDPMATLPFGCPAQLDAGEKRLELLESPTVAVDTP